MRTTDKLLELIVKLGLEADRTSEDSGAFSIILLVGGVLISGKVISERDFLLANPVTALADEVPNREDSEEPAPLEESLARQTEYVHMKEARFLIPGSDPWPEPPIYWRSRLSSVDGFTVGTVKSRP